MGGFGSGRWQHGKNTTDDYPELDIRQLQRNGFLKTGRTFSWKWEHNDEFIETIKLQAEIDLLTLTHRYKIGNDDWKEKCFSIFLDWTPCNFGGKRAWFICSHPGCWRRVAILYCRDVFACRHCYKLAYPCQRETAPDRLARRADRIRKKLGWKEGILNPIEEKPRGMHWKTFEQLSHQHNLYRSKSINGMRLQLGLRR